ncbi:hypothetical protein [Pediococcus pentosaceus]|uniref:hypothetical protein n=1 Tax=Pediococcus pentosaceus TaxID=1255 RepID=UPI0021A58897|nr:hypothetical protein [Pediococcus pentosaceus]
MDKDEELRIEAGRKAAMEANGYAECLGCGNMIAPGDRGIEIAMCDDCLSRND